MILVRRHPIVISLFPAAREAMLEDGSLTTCVHLLGLPLGSSASGLQLCQTLETVVVLVAEVQDAVTVVAAVANLISRACGVEQKPAITFVEGYESGVAICAGLYEAAPNSAFPIWFLLTDRVPEFDVVPNAHVEVRLWMLWFEIEMILSILCLDRWLMSAMEMCKGSAF